VFPSKWGVSLGGMLGLVYGDCWLFTCMFSQQWEQVSSVDVNMLSLKFIYSLKSIPKSVYILVNNDILVQYIAWRRPPVDRNMWLLNRSGWTKCTVAYQLELCQLRLIANTMGCRTLKVWQYGNLPTNTAGSSVSSSPCEFALALHRSKSAYTHISK